MRRRRREVRTFGKESPSGVYPEGKSFFVQKTLDSDSLDSLWTLLKEQPETTTVRFESYGGVINDVGQTETAFVHRRGRLSNAVLNFEPTSPNSNGNRLGMKWIHQFFELGKSIFGQRETYQNYVDAQIPDYLQRYYGGNLRRLIQIKQKYDPENYFNQTQSIPTRI